MEIELSGLSNIKLKLRICTFKHINTLMNDI